MALLPAAAMVLAWVPIYIRLTARENLPALIIAFDRLLIAALALGLYATLFHRRSFAQFTRRALVAAVCAGVFFAIHIYLFILAVQYTTVANAVLLIATIPIFAAIFGHLFLKEKPHPLSYAAIAFAAFGTSLVVWTDLRWDPAHLTGDLFGLFSALAGAGYFLMRRTLPQKDLPAFFPYILTVYAAAFTVLLALVIAAGTASQILPRTPTAWLWLVLLGVVGTALGHSLYNKALDYFKAYVAGSWILTEPILSAVLAWIILDESFNRYVFLAVIPIYFGVISILRLESRS